MHRVFVLNKTLWPLHHNCEVMCRHLPASLFTFGITIEVERLSAAGVAPHSLRDVSYFVTFVPIYKRESYNIPTRNYVYRFRSENNHSRVPTMQW